MTEEEAAKQYDLYVVLKFNGSIGTKTNGFYTYKDYNEIIKKGITLDSLSIKSKPKTKIIPKNIFKTQNMSYYSKIIINSTTYLSSCKNTIKEALDDLELLKEKSKKSITKSITKNKNNETIIITSKGEEIIIDEDKFEELSKFKWRCCNYGYACTTYKKKSTIMHRYLLNAKPGEIVDHIDGNKLNNKLSNLRIVSVSINSQNTPKKKTENPTSKYIGVHMKSKNRWISKIRKNNIDYHIGIYKTELDAAKAYKYRSNKKFWNTCFY